MQKYNDCADAGKGLVQLCYGEIDTFDIMKNILFYSFSLLLVLPMYGQISCTPEDSLLFQKKITELSTLRLSKGNDQITAIGQTFLGTPYVAKTLELGTKETLVVNLRGLDCTTFVENVLAFADVLNEEAPSFDAYTKALETIRYRNGFLNGYTSRLHYFTEWILNNKEKGLIEDITANLGGQILQKPINFMGTHRHLYPYLKDDTNYDKMLAVEAKLAERELCYIPQQDIAGIEKELANGDIIALATSIKGLDVTHTGFAIRMPNGRVHLLHASSTGEVTISKQPLVDYLKKIKHNIGIMVARPL